MTTNDQDAVPSPCVGVCTMSETTGLCLGCYRTLDEIRGWWDMAPNLQKDLIKQLEEREKSHDPFA